METIKAENFSDFPIDAKTKKGLLEAGYITPTQIQKDSIGLALKGFDLVGAAKTGNGKTLAFVIPLLEILHRERWSKIDGLGALIITPTRELAYQIFEVVKRVGKYHSFSLGLVIGGKDLKFEWNRLHVCNIMICTPGRLLQHMEMNHHFNADNLKLLVLDEADRMLDMGFAETMNAAFEYLPRSRQTLLFSATQTRSVSDLARLNLKKPVLVSVHEKAAQVTPTGLVQSYIVCELHQKMNILWSFLKSHLHNKIIVFFSTCKQTNFMYELFRQMKLKTTFLALYGTLHQLRRMDIYDEFCRKQNAILFATDVASRGLDFPDINWVVQFDCPENTNAYIHRVGRTARHTKSGESVLFLLPSEESMIEQLQEKKIPINQIEVDPKRIRSIEQRTASLCAMDVDLKERAQRCFKTYLKSIFFMKDKSIFDVRALDFEAYAHSLGLEVSPRLRMFEKNKELNEKMKQIRLKQSQTEKKSNVMQKQSSLSDDSKDETEQHNEVKTTSSSAKAQLTGSVDQQTKATAYTSFSADDESDNDLLVLKRKMPCGQTQNGQDEMPKPPLHIPKRRLKPVSKETMAKRLLKRGIVANTKKRFYGDSDDDLSDADLDLNIDHNFAYAKKKLAREDEKDKYAYKLVTKMRAMKNKKMKAGLEVVEQMKDKARTLGISLTGKNRVRSDDEDDGIEFNVDKSQTDDHDDEPSENENESSMDTDDEEQATNQTQKYIDELPDPDLLYPS